MRTSYFNCAKLLKIEREEYETKEESELRTLEELLTRDTLFLDDFSSENVNKKTIEFIYLLLNGAIEQSRPRFFITGNLDLKHISANISDRLASRLSGLCGLDNIIELKDQDWRTKG